MSDSKNPLELWVVEQIKAIDKFCHKTSGSGCGDLSKGDIANKYFFVECKIRHTQENIVVQWHDLWLKHINQMPIASKKTPIIVIENKYGEKFVTLKAIDFFNLMKEE